MSLTTTIVVELLSDTVVAVTSRMYACPDSRISVHIVTAPAALVAIMGAAGPNPAELNNLMVIDITGATGDYNASAALAAGFWEIIGRPNWVAVRIAIDAGGPRNYRVHLQLTPED